MAKSNDVEIYPFRVYLKGALDSGTIMEYLREKYQVEKLFMAGNPEEFIITVGVKQNAISK